MSSRVRILFHCALEGNRAHVGLKALKRMEAFIRQAGRQKAGPAYEWISQKEWIRRGKPFSAERAVEFALSGHYYKHRVLKAPTETPQQAPQPEPKGPVERAKWLWQNLPEEIRKRSQLTVTRESRNMRWKRSTSNPLRYGWALKAPNPLGADAEYPAPLLESDGLSWKWDAAGYVVAIAPEDSEAVKAIKQEIGAKYSKYASGSAQRRFKPNSSAPAAKAPLQQSQPAAISPTVPKPKLRLGIWA